MNFLLKILGVLGTLGIIPIAWNYFRKRKEEKKYRNETLRQIKRELEDHSNIFKNYIKRVKEEYLSGDFMKENFTILYTKNYDNSNLQNINPELVDKIKRYYTKIKDFENSMPLWEDIEESLEECKNIIFLINEETKDGIE